MEFQRVHMEKDHFLLWWINLTRNAQWCLPQWAHHYVYSEKDNADQSIDNFKEKMSLASNGEDFPGGPVAKTARPNAGDLGSISGRGTGSHML